MESSGMTADTTHRIGVETSDKNIREFEAVLSKCLPALYRRAFRYLGNFADAEDAVQDALLSAHKNLGQFRGHAQMSTWLMTILINSARMQMRRRPHLRQISLEEPPMCMDSHLQLEYLSDRRPSPEQACCEAELIDHVFELAPDLPPGLRTAFELRDLEGLSIREITHRLGVTAGGAKSQISRARARLRGLMPKRHTGLLERGMSFQRK